VRLPRAEDHPLYASHLLPLLGQLGGMLQIWYAPMNAFFVQWHDELMRVTFDTSQEPPSASVFVSRSTEKRRVPELLPPTINTQHTWGGRAIWPLDRYIRNAMRVAWLDSKIVSLALFNGVGVDGEFEHPEVI
jgi:hypothetical protein